MTGTGTRSAEAKFWQPPALIPRGVDPAVSRTAVAVLKSGG
jgi:hypothetical protein